MQLLWLLILGYLGWSVWRGYVGASAEARKQRLQSALWYAGTLFLVFWAFRGGGLWLAAALLVVLLANQGAAALKRAKARGGRQRGTRRNPMTRAQALKVLGLPSNASKEQVNTRYRELMRSRHPDQGGSQEDAANLNMARSVLLDDEV
jgi:hypothetical protein